MNKLYYILAFALLFFGLSGCDKDFLERPPKDEVDAEFFFNTVKDLEVATNDFYTILDAESHYHDDASSDNILPTGLHDRLLNRRLVPSKRGTGGWSWGRLRDINFFLSRYQKVDDEDAKRKYGGIARFFRAYFYFDKVKQFGDVPWYNKVLEAGDKDMYKPRDSRELIMDSVLADINYAIENIPAKIELNRITKYTALLLKARIALHEGTFRKYHGLDNYERFLREAVSTSQELINLKVYSLFTEGKKENVYRELFERDNQDATETILAANFQKGVLGYNTGYLMVNATYGAWSLNKELVNSYLMQDGSRFTDRPDYKTVEFYEEMQNRDPRLTQSTAGPNFVVKGENAREPVNLNLATSGYRVIKTLHEKAQWITDGVYADLILFRYAEALLILAEAKAELGTLTQADLDQTINLLRDRVGMPHLNLQEANSNPDPYLENMYLNVDKGANKGVILEIRRERRIELLIEGFRWDDLMRWKEGKKIERIPMVGIYFSRLGAHDFNGDGIPDVYLHDGDASGVPPEVTSVIDIRQKKLRDPITGERSVTSGNIDPYPNGGAFDESKDYYYPIPSEDLELNKNLVQNPNWD